MRRLTIRRNHHLAGKETPAEREKRHIEEGKRIEREICDTEIYATLMFILRYDHLLTWAMMKRADELYEKYTNKKRLNKHEMVELEVMYNYVWDIVNLDAEEARITGGRGL